ncbi:MAG: hypothetical protein Q7T74_07550 [Candidatus Saccharibacteria bacterium]|nr:hypothetical protein [Candidatus Saccharibacteria bacterium]
MNLKSKIFRTYIVLAMAFVLSFIPLHSAVALDTGVGACSGNNSAPCAATGDDIATIIGSVISLLLFLAGAIAALVIVVGGIRYITSDGDAGAASKAKNTIIYALVGLVIAIMSYSIVNFVISKV